LKQLKTNKQKMIKSDSKNKNCSLFLFEFLLKKDSPTSLDFYIFWNETVRKRFLKIMIMSKI